MTLSNPTPTDPISARGASAAGRRRSRAMPDAHRISGRRALRGQERARRRRSAARSCRANEFEILILDVMLPSVGGFDVLRKLGASYETPILMLTARGDDVDRIVGLELGRRRLPEQALQSARAGGAHPRHPAPRQQPRARSGRAGRTRRRSHRAQHRHASSARRGQARCRSPARNSACSNC